MINLVVAKTYLSKLFANVEVRSYVERHAPEIVEQLDRIIETASMEAAVE